MNAQKWPLAVIGALVLGALVLLGWQHHTTEQLRSEIARQRVDVNERARLRHENARLAAAQVPAKELEDLRAERAALDGLRAEIATMRRRADATVQAQTSRRATTAALAVTEPSMKDGPVTAQFWKNAGQVTPEAAFETALWAAAGGDVESLAKLLLFETESRARAEALFAKLPPALQQELTTPERLIALLVAKDVPLGSARILAQSGTPSESNLMALLLDPENKSKRVKLSLRAEAGSWRFVVPASAVERYATLLQTPVAAR